MKTSVYLPIIHLPTKLAYLGGFNLQPPKSPQRPGHSFGHQVRVAVSAGWCRRWKRRRLSFILADLGGPKVQKGERLGHLPIVHWSNFPKICQNDSKWVSCGGTLSKLGIFVSSWQTASLFISLISEDVSCPVDRPQPFLSGPVCNSKTSMPQRLSSSR